MSDPRQALDRFRLDGRVVVVTGASSGIGARLARVLHGAGATVVLAARRADRLAVLAEELPGALAVPCDVGEADDRSELVAVTVESFGRIDVLVNNAGTGIPGPAESQPLEDFRSVLEVNLVGLYHLCQLAGSQMIEQGAGSVVNMASMLGLVSSAPIADAGYAASKGAVVNLTRELAVQWARKGVRVNALAPGWFPSEMTTEMFDDERSMDFVRRNTPMARPAEAHELDGAVLFLASDASSFVTGHTLVVDGGWTSR